MGPFFSLSGAGKWLGLVAAIWVQAICGNNYTFANYSDALKSLMSLTQLQLNNLSVAKDVGKAFGLVAGFASDCLPTSVLLIIGSVEGLIGYGAQWLVVSRRIHPLTYWQMCVFLCMGGNSTTWMNTAVLVTCMRNFPKNRGPVSGILKGYVGLSTAIFTDICTALFSSDPSTFLFILAVVPAIVCLTATFFLHEIPTPTKNPTELRQETLYFHVFNGIAIILAVYLLAFDITGNHGRVLSLAFAVGLLVLLATPLSVPLYSFISKPLSDSDIERPMKVSLLADQPKTTTTTGVELQYLERKRPSIGEDHTIVEMIRTFDFWVLFVSFLCGVGTGMCVMNNMGQMGIALGYLDVSIFISLTSIWGFFGRIASGLISEYYIWPSLRLYRGDQIERSLMETNSNSASSKPSASSLRWRILSRAVLHRAKNPEDESQLGMKLISRKAAKGFNLIPCQLLNHDHESRDAQFCYTLPTQGCPKLVLTQRLNNNANLTDFEICNRHNIDNTGTVCQWPSEDVLAYYCLSHADMFRSKRVIELGSGYGLAGLTIAATTEALEVVISDGNPQVVDYILHNINTNSGAFGETRVKPMKLHWNEKEVSNLSHTFDVIVASDCTFFKEFHKDLAQVTELLLKKPGPSEAIFFSPKRGNSLDKFLEEIKDNGLLFSITEIYDTEIWNRHQQFMNGDESWPGYEKDHCYPLLVRITR